MYSSVLARRDALVRHANQLVGDSESCHALSMPPGKLLLIGWDAADWRVIHPLMDAGKMPALRGLVTEGVMANLATLHPVLSPMLWKNSRG